MANDTKLTQLKHLQELATLAHQEAQAVKSAIPSKVSELTNDSGFQTAAQVASAIDSKVSALKEFKGSKAFAELTTDLLVIANNGDVWNITDAFTTTANFVEGAGKKMPAGTDVAIVNTGTDESPVMKFNALGGEVDLSGYIQKVAEPTAGNFAKLAADGSLEDSGKKPADFVEAEENKRLLTDAEGTKLAGIAEGATKTEASDIPGDGTIKVDGASVTVVEIASDTEVTAMLTGVFGTSGSGEGSGNS